MIIIYKNNRINDIILTSSKREAFLETKNIKTEMIDRHMDAVSHNDLDTNKYAPLVAFLYDENKVEVFRGQDYKIKSKLTVTKWSEAISTNVGFILLLPYSEFLVTAKTGETLVWFINYINVGIKDRSIQTAMSEILNISLVPQLKVLNIFDRKL